MDSGFECCPGRGEFPEVDKNYYLLSQVVIIEGISSISGTKAKKFLPQLLARLVAIDGKSYLLESRVRVCDGQEARLYPGDFISSDFAAAPF